MKNFIESVSGTFQQRIAHPFSGSFLVAAIFINWKFFLLILSGLSYSDKLREFSILYGDEWGLLQGFLFSPLLIAILWFFGWPFLNKYLSAFWFSIEADIHNKRVIAEKKKYITEEAAAELYERNDSIRKGYLDLVEERERENKRLIQQAADQLAEINRLNERTVAFDKLEIEVQDLTGRLNKASSDLARLRERNKEIIPLVSGARSALKALKEAPNYSLREDFLRESLAKKLNGSQLYEIGLLLGFLIEIGELKRSDENITFASGSFGFDRIVDEDDFSGFFKKNPNATPLTGNKSS